MALKILSWNRTNLGWYTLEVQTGPVTNWISVCDNDHALYNTIFSMDDTHSLFLSPVMHTFFDTKKTACRATDAPNLYPWEVLTINSLLYQVKKRLESPSNRPANFIQIGMKKKLTWLPPFVKSTTDVQIIFYSGDKGGFCGYRLVAARGFKANEPVAHINLVAEAPGDMSWTDDEVFVSKEKVWSCGPPTSDRLGVLVNASCSTSEKNCTFLKVDQKNKVMTITATKAIIKGTELLAGQYMKKNGLQNTSLGKPGVGSFRQKTCKQIRGDGGRFEKK